MGDQSWDQSFHALLTRLLLGEVYGLRSSQLRALVLGQPLSVRIDEQVVIDQGQWKHSASAIASA